MFWIFTLWGLKRCCVWATSWENLFMPYANNKGADQPAHLHSLISAFVVYCLGTVHTPKCCGQSRFFASEKRITFLIKPCAKSTFISQYFHDIFTLTFRNYRSHNVLHENFALEEYFHASLTLQQAGLGKTEIFSVPDRNLEIGTDWKQPKVPKNRSHTGPILRKFSPILSDI